MFEGCAVVAFVASVCFSTSLQHPNIPVGCSLCSICGHVHMCVCVCLLLSSPCSSSHRCSCRRSSPATTSRPGWTPAAATTATAGAPTPPAVRPLSAPPQPPGHGRQLQDSRTLGHHVEMPFLLSAGHVVLLEQSPLRRSVSFRCSRCCCDVISSFACHGREEMDS